MEAFIICEETNGSAERVLAKYAIDHARAGGGGGGGRRRRRRRRREEEDGGNV